jgi:addiction module RelB/DinJ family antitoxin
LWKFREFMMVAAVQPEIRLRLDGDEREQFERVGSRIGMSANDMVRVFVRRTIAEGGLPFDMKAAANDNVRSTGERSLSIFGQSHALLAEVASEAARSAAQTHVRAGRLAPATMQVEADARAR